MSGFPFILICLIHFGAAKKTCNFELNPGYAALRCFGCNPALKWCDFPSAEYINHTIAGLDNKNILGITILVMSNCFITTLYPQTFDFQTFVQVQTLFLNHNIISRLPEDLFHSETLINLENLYLDHNQISYLSPKLFIHLPVLQRLTLGYNEMKTLESGMFLSNPVTFLELSFNNIELLPYKLFAGNVSFTLKHLNLKRNKLRDVPQCLFQPNTDASEGLYPQLQVLDLGYNNIKELPTNLFNSTNWSFLRKFDVQNNSISSLHPSLFHSTFLIKLTEIDFSYNRLETLPKYFFQNPALANLGSVKFNDNKIKFLPEQLFHSPYLKNLREINLGYNQISFIPPKIFQNAALEYLKLIHLSNNNISSVSEEMFPKKLHGVCKLNLAYNKISSMGDLLPKILKNMPEKSFCNLDISNNRLRIQPTNFIQVKKKSNFTIKGNLNLSQNNISKFEIADIFAKYPKYTLPGKICVTVPLNQEWLDTSGNPMFSVLNLVKAAFVNIDLDHIDLESQLNKSNILTEREFIRLHVLVRAFSYKYDCNCDMLKYLKLQKLASFKNALDEVKHFSTKGSKEYEFLTSTNLQKLKCGSPERLYGKYLYELKETDLQCEGSVCTDNKKCTCVQTPSNHTLRINCSRINMTQIPFIIQRMSNIEIYLGSNAIKEFPIPPIFISVHVTLLDLSHNFITNIPSTCFSRYTNLRILNLVENDLVTLPSDKEWRKINSLYFLEVLGNPFTCNCSGIQLKETIIYLNAKAIFKDIENITCFSPAVVKDRVIYKLPDQLFGCKYVNVVLILTLTLSLLLFVLVVLFVGYIFRYYIRLFLFVHFGWRFWYSYTKDKTPYDAFISYSCKDSDWVIDQLMNPLENLNPPYNLCLHERDFLIGVPICDNISKAIEGSKCTICVVSRNWLESDWCQFEFRVAHCLATVEKQIRLIVILKEEIPKDKINRDLKFYMKTFTYLDSAKPLFLSRLLNDLPRPDTENIIEENELTMLSR